MSSGPASTVNTRLGNHWHCLVLHAERLELDDVWRRTSSLLASLERRGGRATLFVHPYSAIISGFDLTPRLAALMERGHEVGQHTHFYRWQGGATPPPGKPRSDLSGENVRRCLDRDRDYLRAAGVEPRGFTSGGWAIVPELLPWLHRSGFAYDCSVRSFKLRYDSEPADAGGGWSAPRVEGGIVRLPTTSSLRDALASAMTRRPSTLPGPGFRYDLAYAHDYDLIRRSQRVAARAVMEVRRPGRWCTAGQLAGLIRSEARP